jgi:hypothetical protein
MALPLLLAAGAGILGGAQYLMKKHDQREAQNSFLDLQGQLRHSALDPSTQNQILATAQSMLDNDSFFNRQSVNSQLQNLQNQSVTAHQSALFQQQNLAANQMAAWNNSNEARLAQVYEQRKAADTTFGTVQDQARIVDSLFNSGDLSGNNLYAMVNAVAKMQFPNEALNEGDIQRAMMGTPFFADMLNKIKNLGGKADPELARSIYETGQRIFKASKGSYDSAQANINNYIADERNYGYLPTTRANRRFGSVGDYMMGANNTLPPPPAQVPTETVPQVLRATGEDLSTAAESTFNSFQDALEYYKRLGWTTEKP